VSQPADVHSFAQPNLVQVTHCSLDLRVDFQKQELSGTAVLRLHRHDHAAPLLLDSRDLQIEEISTASAIESPDWKGTKYKIGEPDSILGSPIEIFLPPQADLVSVRYRTSPSAMGLQWLQPEQTAGGTAPFLFSQSQSIHARSWFPIQDSPRVRLTYDARIGVEPGLTALMSAPRMEVHDGIHRFAMRHPIPAYLIALAVGKLEFAELGPRTGVYAEPPMLEAVASEFSDLERLVQTVEELYGPYRWDRYEVLVLPPSFPLGGMENPVVTFATPTIIAGDKSLVSLISHELAHSWSGNLVTNATWRDFWLNEGFTTYLENRIQEAVYGREQAVMEQVIDRRDLDKELAEFAPADQILHIDLTGRDPDDGVTKVPYIKGALFLRLLEQTFGRPAFDEFLKKYFDHFAFQSITTETALRFLQAELFARFPQKASSLRISEWVYEPGLPASAPAAESEKLSMIAGLALAWASDEGSLDGSTAAGWNSQGWLEFLQTLPHPISTAKLAQLDGVFHLTSTGNYEILQQWLFLAIANEYAPAFARLETFLLSVGRIKYIRPLYQALLKTEGGALFARELYTRARPRYHPLAQSAIDKVLSASEPS
jgi:leukotriene-A4 hydrolase